MSLIAMNSAIAMIRKSKIVCRKAPYFSTTAEPSGAAPSVTGDPRN